MTLVVENMNKYYGRNQVLKNVCFRAESGRIMALLGRNGHGKSTTMKILLGLIEGDNREKVTIDGKPKWVFNPRFGYLPEDRGLYQKVPVMEQMVYFAKLRGMPASEAKQSASDLLERLHMTEFAKKNASTLSRGNQQKIQLAIALLDNPNIIVLDEPFAGLDPVSAKMMHDIIAERAKAGNIVIFSSHQVEVVEGLCEDVCILKEGQVMLNGNLKEIKSTYPQDRIFVSAELGKEDALKSVLDNQLAPFILKYERMPNGDFVLRTTHNDDKSRIINRLITSGVGVETVYVVRPSLLEIFLEKVGEVGNERA